MVLVEGRLLDERTGDPVQDAWVMGMLHPHTTDHEVARSKTRNAEQRDWLAESGNPSAHWDDDGATDPEAVVDAEGRFVLRQWVGTSRATALSGRILSETGNEERLGLDTLYIERDGHPPIRVRVPHSDFQWLESRGASFPWVRARWNLGDIRVPTDKP